jgi:endo-1,3(4)-beta-glucanase
MWFEIDLNEVRAVSGLALDTAGSPNDYPRGYIIRLSTDHNQWEEVARNDRNDRALDVTFTPRLARYIRIEQTGSADRWWWSIHQISIKD